MHVELGFLAHVAGQPPQETARDVDPRGRLFCYVGATTGRGQQETFADEGVDTLGRQVGRREELLDALLNRTVGVSGSGETSTSSAEEARTRSCVHPDFDTSDVCSRSNSRRHGTDRKSHGSSSSCTTC
jgi:hypothetical protein